MGTAQERKDPDLRKYLELRLNELKLNAVDGLAVALNRVLSLMMAIMLGAIALAALAFGTVLLLGDIIGSQAVAAFIMGGFFIFILALMLLLRKRLFVNMFVRLFIGIFYENE